MIPDFDVIAITPASLCDPSVALAACRAGGIGVLDMIGGPCDEQVTATIIGMFRRTAIGRTGIRCEASDERALALSYSDVPSGNAPPVDLVILTLQDPDLLRERVRALRARRITVVLEATSVEDARLGVRVGVNALIAKGNEAGGRVGEESTFILLQRLLRETSLPLWVQGGIGLHSAAGCYAAGAAGVVLDAQLGLTRESPLPEATKAVIARMDGSETICLGTHLGHAVRLYHRPGLAPVERLRAFADLLSTRSPDVAVTTEWSRVVRDLAGWNSPDEHLLLLGQDAAFAAPLAAQHHTVGGVIGAMLAAVNDHVRIAKEEHALRPGAPLAADHGTRYPVVQGPMTRVSDRATFTAAIAEAGALPFVALAVMPGEEVAALLEQTRRELGDRPWGVGILGFVPPDLRDEQLAVIRTHSPTYALIAGGRPDQALALEEAGIPTYLHVPSPGLLRLFLEQGARRFVFEGRECGGHVGPRSSFVLWDSAVETLLAALPDEELARCRVLFAGGIHDDLSAAVVSALAAPLVSRGAKIGVLLGTAYLFTREAVSSGAITPGFQRAAVACAHTALLETGPGHATRCAHTPYVETFRTECRRLLDTPSSPEERRAALEELNLGRLRIAAKGVTRNQTDHAPAAQRLVPLEDDEQWTQGMYMLGQVAALRDAPCTLEELHRQVCAGSDERLEALPDPSVKPSSTARTAGPADIAVVGMSCLLPKAPDLRTYWENILGKVDAIDEVPVERWDWRKYFDADPTARDKIYSKWGGFLDDVVFDPLRYGIPPTALPSIEPMQLLTLEAVSAALDDAGYADRTFSKRRTAVILGVGGGTGDLGQRYAVRSGLPMVLAGVDPDVYDLLPEWTEDSFPGILLNVTAGRVANRFDLGGVNFTVDAACASSLASVYLGARELQCGTSDFVIVGGADTVQNPFGYLCFSKTHALSPTGRCRPFDELANGIVISEGVVILVLRRLADAERDGDRIYAVIKGIAGSSDGRDKGLVAPRPQGQMLALQRAYEAAGLSPATVGLVEAHGTGTIAGDRAEAEALRSVLRDSGAITRSCAVGSVKSMIGHTKCTAGVAGLAKVALALYHKVLPATINVDKPNSTIGDDSPLYVNTETRPWVHTEVIPRRAAVSAFGFGGINFHAVLEEHPAQSAEPVSLRWPCELFVWAADSPRDLAEAVAPVRAALDRGEHRFGLADLAAGVWRATRTVVTEPGAGLVRLAVTASSFADLAEKLERVLDMLRQGPPKRWHDPRGIDLNTEPLPGQLVFLFPGQGSQHVDMLRELAVVFPKVRESFERADRTLHDVIPERVSSYVYPPPRFTAEEQQLREHELMRTEIAQPALGAAALAILRLLHDFGVRPDMAAGHSYGEYAALCCAGVLDEAALLAVSAARGRCIADSAGAELGAMAAVAAQASRVDELLSLLSTVWVANVNAPEQTVISGNKADLSEALRHLQANGISGRLLPVACGFHSPLVAPAAHRLAEVLTPLTLRPPRLPVYSNTSAAPYPADPDQIRELLVRHLVEPVRFVEEITAMYQAGARVFLEVGPRSVLTGLVRETLGECPHLAVETDGHSGLRQLQTALGRLFTVGIPVDLDGLFSARVEREPDLSGPGDAVASPPVTAWRVNGGSACPVAAALPEESVGPVTMPPVTRVRLAQAAPAEPTSSLMASAEPMSPPAQGCAEPELVAFQRLMSRFLDTQEKVMLARLGRTQPYGAPAAAAGPAIAAPDASAPTGAMPHISQPSAAPVDIGRPGQPAPEAVNTAAPAPAARLTAADVTAALVGIVSERTGYPAEILDLDLDIEADLGMDSIKRVEILGALQRACLPDGSYPGQEAMERLVSAKTLRAVTETFSSVTSTLSNVPTPASAPVSRVRGGGESADPTAEPLIRYVLRTVPAPQTQGGHLPSGTVLVTDDEGGTAVALVEELRHRGVNVVLVRYAEIVGDTAMTTRSAAVADLVVRVQVEHGPVRTLIHLLPLRSGTPFTELDLAAWQRRLQEETESLLHLAQALCATAEDGSGPQRILAAVALGGDFGREATNVAPTHGAVAGLVKTLAVEYEHIRCRVVDLEDCAPTTRAGYLMAELFADDDLVEVGYRDGRRTTLLLQAADVTVSTPAWVPDDSSVLLVTGGARGITAEIVQELAQRYRPTLLLVGRTPLSEEPEPESTAGIEDPRELRSALITALRAAGAPPEPAGIETAYRQLRREREILRTLEAARSAGARVHYYAADLANETAVRQLLEGIYQEFGGIDGVIHGAGIIEDRLIADKDVASFRRVIAAKADSAFLLTRLLRPESLRFLAFFSSVAGRFGNRGQCDYVAANELLDKLAALLDRHWPGRVVALCWGPWAAGMASPQVQRRFRERGVQVIESPAGRRAFVAELTGGRKGEFEVVLGDGPWRAADETSRRANVRPLLDGSVTWRTDGPSFLRRLTLDADPYLDDHRIDGRPVLPAAFALELMAELAVAARPELVLTAVRDFRVLHGVILEGDAAEVRGEARVEGEPGTRACTLRCTLVNPTTSRPHYTALLDLRDRMEAPPRDCAEPPRAPDALCRDEAYDRWLFHGELLRGIARVDGVGAEGVMATLRPSRPERLVPGAPGTSWILDPVVIDSAFQLAIIWARSNLDMTPLPTGFRRYSCLGDFSDPSLRCELRAHASAGGHLLETHIAFRDGTGRLIGRFDSMEFSCSSALNRLASVETAR